MFVQSHFVALVELLLTTADVPFEKRDLIDWTEAMWPHIVAECSPGVVVWAERFADACTVR